MALGDLIALDDLVAVDRADAGHDLLIFDPLAGRLVDLMELDRRAALGGGVTARRESTPKPAGFVLARSDAQPSNVSFAERFNHCVAELFPRRRL